MLGSNEAALGRSENVWVSGIDLYNLLLFGLSLKQQCDSDTGVGGIVQPYPDS